MTAMCAEPQRREILETVARLVREVIGDEEGLVAEITEATSFSTDLELESIEFVALAEKIQLAYGARVDFVGWLSQKELDAIIGLRVGDLVELIDQCHR